MRLSQRQQGYETPRLTSQKRAVLELLCRYDPARNGRRQSGL